MTVSATSQADPLSPPRGDNWPIVKADGTLTEYGSQMLEEWRSFISGMGRVIPCDIWFSGNVATLTPTASAVGLVKKYSSFDIYAVVIDDAFSGGGELTAYVESEGGSLETLNCYIGGVPVTSGDLTANLLYLFVYCDRPDATAGGCFQVK